MRTPLGVGIIGAGPATQAIHLPTLATLRDRLRVVHIMDVDATVAAPVAARADARWTTDVRALLDDPAVEVVAICSPHRFHADQVEAAARAGKRGVLCEKPLATTVDAAQRIVDVSAASGMPVVVGAMHVHDPAVVAAGQAWGPTFAAEVRLVRGVAYLPANEELVALASDQAMPARASRPADQSDPAVRVDRIREGVLGLATHSLPFVRQFVPSVGEVFSAVFLAPFGYELTFRDGDRVAQLLALMECRWRPEWTVHACSPDREVRVRFPPSYVLAGSAVATVATATARMSWQYPHNGYQAEWRHLADVVEGRTALAVPVQAAVDDMVYALRLADGAANLVREQR